MPGNTTWHACRSMCTEPASAGSSSWGPWGMVSIVNRYEQAAVLRAARYLRQGMNSSAQHVLLGLSDWEGEPASW